MPKINSNTRLRCISIESDVYYCTALNRRTGFKNDTQSRQIFSCKHSALVRRLGFRKFLMLSCLSICIWKGILRDQIFEIETQVGYHSEEVHHSQTSISFVPGKENSIFEITVDAAAFHEIERPFYRQ